MKPTVLIIHLLLFLGCAHTNFKIEHSDPPLRRPTESRKNTTRYTVAVFDFTTAPDQALKSYRHLTRIYGPEIKNKQILSNRECPQESQKVETVLERIIQSNNFESILIGDLNYTAYVDCGNSQHSDARTSYGSTFLTLKKVQSHTNEELAVVLTHELSHHLLAHDLDNVKEKTSAKDRELEADINGYKIFINSGFANTIYYDYLKSLEEFDSQRGFYPSSLERIKKLNDFERAQNN